MKQGWEYKKLGEVCETCSGGTPSKSHTEYYEGGTIPWLRSGEVSQGNIYTTELFITEQGLANSSAKMIPENTVSITMYGATIGEVGIIRTTMCTNQAICNILPNKTYKAEFLRYFLISQKEHFIKKAAGGAQPNISQDIIRNTLIPLPPLSTQQSIVAELDDINNLLSLKRKELETYDKLAQSVFYEMFGDLLDGHKVSLSNLAKAQNGLVSPKEEPYSSMYHVGPANIVSHTGELINLQLAKNENLISGKYLFQPGMILYSKIRPNLDKVAIATFEGICSADMYPLIPEKNVLPEFLLFILRTKDFLNYAISNSGRANIPKINREALFQYKTILPPLPLQQAFAERIEAIEEQKVSVKAAIEKLETLLAARMQYWFE